MATKERIGLEMIQRALDQIVTVDSETELTKKSIIQSYQWLIANQKILFMQTGEKYVKEKSSEEESH